MVRNFLCFTPWSFGVCFFHSNPRNPLSIYPALHQISAGNLLTNLTSTSCRQANAQKRILAILNLENKIFLMLANKLIVFSFSLKNAICSVKYI